MEVKCSLKTGGEGVDSVEFGFEVCGLGGRDGGCITRTLFIFYLVYDLFRECLNVGCQVVS